MTLKDWIESTGAAAEFADLVDRHGHLEVVKAYSAHEGGWRPFPQKNRTYRNVLNWVLLSDGSAVGWNESPRSGWSFPRIGARTVSEVMQ